MLIKNHKYKNQYISEVCNWSAAFKDHPNMKIYTSNGFYVRGVSYTFQKLEQAQEFLDTR